VAPEENGGGARRGIIQTMSLPLAGLTVLVTRPAEHGGAWAKALEAAGANAVPYPTVEVVPPPSWEPLDEAFARLSEYHWLVFTSAAAARFALRRLAAGAVPALAAADRPRVAAVGRETARAIEEHGLRVAVIPEDPRQEGLIDALGTLPPGTRVLFPRAIGGRDELRNALLARGCVVDVVPASQTVPRRDLPPPPPFDVAAFASPSALRAFVATQTLAPLERALVAVIGPTTASAARALGLNPITADAPTAEALVRVISTNRSKPQGAA
jgi:uroporphyrinogen-III synthase